MKTIFSSASKIVFILLALTACLAILIEILKGVIVFEEHDFMILAVAAFSFYFGKGTIVQAEPPEIVGRATDQK